MRGRLTPNPRAGRDPYAPECALTRGTQTCV